MNERTATSASTTGSPSDLSGDSDYDLLQMISWRKTDEDIAREAFAVFYRRHVRYMFGICRRFAEGIGGDQAAEDLVGETFKRVFESGAPTFKPGLSHASEDMRKHVLGWLASIAENLAKDALACDGAKDCYREQDYWQDLPDQPAPTESAATRRVREIMDSVLSERERFVIPAKFQWYQPGNDHQRLPNEVAAGLASALNTSSENVRQIASRAYRKVKEALLHGTDGSLFNDQDVV